MTKDQRGKLVGMIYEYGNAVGRAVQEGRVPGEDEAVGREVAAIRAFLDELTEAEPKYVEIDGGKFEV